MIPNTPESLKTLSESQLQFRVTLFAVFCAGTPPTKPSYEYFSGVLDLLCEELKTRGLGLK